MRISYLLILLLYTGLCCAELLGPESRRKDEKTPNSDDDEDPETMESNEKKEPQQFSLKGILEQAQEMEDYIAALKEVKRAAGEDEDVINNINMESVEVQAKLLDNIRVMKQKMLSQMNPNLLDALMDGPGHNNELIDENPQELLDNLPPPPEEPELTPELQEAKKIFDDAEAKIKRRTADLRGAILQVKEAADMGYVPAKIKLAWSHVFGEGVELDPERARVVFEELAREGVADAHSGMGFLYSNGISVPVSQAKALVHYWMGAAGDSTHSQMALAYRHWVGVTVPASCPKALQLYSQVAAKVAAQVSLSGGAAIQRVRLRDEAEGGGALDTDLVEYYQLLAEKGDVQAQVGLGQLHFQGGRGVTLDAGRALHYFTQAAAAGNAVANAFLGKIYLEGGDGVIANNETALRYFKKAAELNNPVGQSGLGIMYLQGRGVPKDYTAAFKYFTMAANQGWVEGQLHLGFMYFGGIGVRRDFKQANKYFSLASQSGHVLAFYHLGLMHAQGLGVQRACSTAVELFKNVCERGPWSSRLMLAHAAWRARDTVSSLLQYLALADLGLEVAQSNAATLLDEGEVDFFPEEERWSRALQLWGRAAGQGYSVARVKLGDYHYYGLGTPVDLEAAAHHYRIASEQQHNAQATFNLGYMHERGLGLARDQHLAKRCYDLAADAAPEARLPAALALARLQAVQLLESLQVDSPLAMVFVSGDSTLLSNWDLCALAALLGALGLVAYWRRPRPAA